MNALFAVAGALEYAAVEIARHLRKHAAPAPRSRGATLRPGVETPLWLALVAMTEPQLKKRGAKALLARELGVDRSRVSEFFVKKSAMPDAERTLELMVWLGRQAREARRKAGAAGARNPPAK